MSQVAKLHRILPVSCNINTNEFYFRNFGSCFFFLEQQFPVCMFGNTIFCMEQQFLDSLILVSFSSSGLPLPFGGVSFNNANLVKSSPWLWQMSVLIDIPIIITLLFLCNLQICTSWPGDINITQWNRIWLFSRNVQLNFSVQHDDDEWNSFRASAWAQKSLLIPSSSVSSGWNSSLSPWDYPLRFFRLAL